MQANASMRQRARLGFLLPLLLMAGCGTGDGPTPIPGTPAPPRPPVTCDTINFEDGCGPFSFSDFAGGVASVVRNPEAAGLNTTSKVAKMQKFAGENFGGSTLDPPEAIDLSRGAAFKMKVWASRAVPVLFKLEGLAKERTANHSGSGNWEEVCFSFVGDTAGNPVTGITFIFDLGVMGNAAVDPDNWTFYFDEIEQVDSCPVPPPLFPVDFEGDPASYNFGADGGFGGGASSVIANPDQSGLNASAQVARMQKFAGEVFGGSTLTLANSVDFSKGSAFKLKVWASREVPVLFKFEGLAKERTATHSGSSSWEQVCFDFTGDTAGPATSAITFIFDLGVVGDANNNPDAWTFYFDDIEQVESCGAPAGPLFPVSFEGAPASYDFGAEGGFGGGVTTVIANPDPSGLNTSAQVARMQKFAGEVFAGSTLGLGGNVDFTQGEAFKVKVWASRAVPMLFKFEGLNQERTLNHSGSGGWEELCFDFAGSTAGPTTNAITFIFDLGVAGAAATDPDNWTFYFDDIEQVESCGAPAGPLFPVSFEGAPASYDFGADGGFGGGVTTVIANPDPSGLNTSAQVARMQKFAGEVFAGSTLGLGGNVDFTQGEAFKVKVWASRAVPMLFKFEGLNQERTLNHSGSGGWEELCFDFAGSTAGPTTNAITVIFDLGVTGAAATDPDNWTFYFDDIEQVASCGGGGGGGGTATSVDFEGDAASYDFGADGGFGGGVSTVVANPDQGGLNTSAQVVQMQKFAGEVYGGSTLAWPAGIDWSQGETFTMKVWSQRAVPVLLKLEGVGQERSDDHDGGSQWQELCYDFTGTTGGQPLTGFTLIFDLGVAGDAANDPDNWTFYYDDIQQKSGGCPTTPAPTFETVTFDDPDITYTLTDFGGNASTVTNDPAGGTNNVVQVVKPVGAELWAGTTVSTLPGDQLPTIPLDAANTQMSVRVYSPDAGIPVRLKVEDADTPGVSVETEAVTTAVNAWETLTFDFANEASGTPAFNEANTYNRASIFFNFGTTGNDAGEKTYYFDDIAFGPGASTTGELAVNGGFEAGDLSGWEVFPNNGSITVVNTESSSGTYSVHVVAGPTQNPVVKQERRAAGTVNPGDTINISFDMKGSAADGGVIFPELISEGAGGATGQLLETIASPAAGWTTYSYSPTAGADVSGGITFQLAVVCGGVPTCSADVFIDNVSITIAP